MMPDHNQFQLILSQVKPDYHERFRDITAMTDTVCATLTPLDHEYRVYCWLLAGGICQEGEEGTPPLACDRSQARSWAAGVLWTLADVNFLADPGSEPYASAREVAEAFDLSSGTMRSKATAIREYLDIIQLDPRWTLPSLAMQNPLVWMVETENGMIRDIRDMPKEVQVEAYEEGLIPFVPADAEWVPLDGV